ncbi:4-hydroxyphenylpyruvate dioxygenase [Elongatibacter sediminis]|uniref:4-hydroxyphenylpyruvate dioxygenase n=1 Tax=Elongatibacter sediminis TaxID=3119006 RepID=A0AAW9RAF0_9GAMM
MEALKLDEQHDNPLGVAGFEFIEFAAPEPEQLHELFTQMGFSAVGKHQSRDIVFYRQGGVNFLLNREPGSFALKFAEKHGPSCTGFALRVAHRQTAFQSTVANGAKAMTEAAGCAMDCPRIEGVGGSLLYLVDGRDGSPFNAEYVPVEGADVNPKGFGLVHVDHLTHNVFEGHMDEWADYYTRLFGFYEARYFDIRGQQTGLRSRAMTAPNGQISIPINESSEANSQINEYLEAYNGEGIQHIALYTNDIYATVESMRAAGLGFMETPDTYYELIEQRVPEHGEDIARMKKNQILLDADPETGSKQLLQIFTDTCIGPIFFEIIKRKGNTGFGEGNFQALFDSIELDQMRRGVL